MQHPHDTRQSRRQRQLELRRQQQQQEQQQDHLIAMAQIGPEEATLRQLLTTANVQADVRDAIVLEGMADYDACIYFSYKTVNQISTRRARQPNNVAINVVACWRIATVAFYVQGKLQMGQEPDVQEFDQAKATELQRILITRENDIERNVQPEVPPLTHPNQWLQFKEAVESYLGSIRGVSGIPLRYIIRDDAENQLFLSENASWDTQLWTTALHEGAHYIEDRKEVFQLLNTKINCVEGTSAKAYFLDRVRVNEQDGRSAWLYFMSIYNSPNTANIRLNEADKELSALYFTGKKAYPFDIFTRDFELVLQLFMSAGAPKSDSEKLRYLLSHCTAEKMTSTIAALENRVPNGLTYVQAMQALTDSARRHYPDSTSSSVGIRNVGSTRTNSFNKKKGGKKKSNGKSLAKLLGADGNLSVSHFRGVDVTDVTRSFNKDEMKKLKGTDIWDYIKKKREDKQSTERHVKAASQIASMVVDTMDAALATTDLTAPQKEVSGSNNAEPKKGLDKSARDQLVHSIAFASANLMKKGGQKK